jgi:hypothetical protein
LESKRREDVKLMMVGRQVVAKDDAFWGREPFELGLKGWES